MLVVEHLKNTNRLIRYYIQVPPTLPRMWTLTSSRRFVSRQILNRHTDFHCILQVANNNGDVIFMGPTKQRSFLHRIGIEYRVNALTANMQDKKQIDNLKQCYHFLTDESKMGERFKFCTLLPATLKKILEKYPVVGFT